jgi:Zn-dependent metalloprotease
VDPSGAAAQERLMAQRTRLGLGPETTFEVRDVERDPSGTVHVRLQQRYRGVKVWGGQAIAHTGAPDAPFSLTNALVPNLSLEVNPNLTAQEALAVAHGNVAPTGSYARPPTAELVIYPESALRPAFAGSSNAEDFTVERVRTHLAYHLHLELQNGAPETRHDDFLIDAHTGAILKAWSSLLTLAAGTPVITTGNSQYSGEVRLGSLAVPCGFVLSDPTRNDLSTRNMDGRTSGPATLYVSSVPYWGDGQNYEADRGSRSENGQTAAVDAHYGLQTAWDFYKNILGRNGIDGKGTTPHNLVHYAKAYDNAFWSDLCFCMTYGDGNAFKTLTAMDVVGHEISHGLCHATADLGYLGETGGLNEANSDIFGAMIGFYANGALGQGSAIPEVGGRWSIGHDLQTAAFPHPLRYMRKPSLDGFSPDAWSPALDFMDVHFSSGPMNRAFYFLSQGSSSNKAEDTYSSYLPKGMTGIGNDKALRIWWRNLSTHLTPASRYVDARNGAVLSAQELFGKASPEVTAVRKAFKAINVGQCEPKRHPMVTRSQEPVDMDTSD